MNGTRPNRAAGTGFWKATGADKDINFNGEKVGVKKALVFYRGKPPKGVKTDWIMQEYRVDNLLSPRVRRSTSTNDMRVTFLHIFYGSTNSCLFIHSKFIHLF